MSLGGGTFLVQNKVLPGSYINFISASRASATLTDRGTATMPVELDWGADGEMFTVTSEEFQKDSMRMFGHAYTDDALKPLRELFTGIKTAHLFKINSGGAKASNKFATARYTGARGNDLKIMVEQNEAFAAGSNEVYDVSTLLGPVCVDAQKGIAGMADLKDNDYVRFARDATLEQTAALVLTGGSNGTVEDANYQTYLDLAESYSYNTMGCAATSATVKALFAAYNKRMREECGVKFQTVLFRHHAADFEGVVSVENGLIGAQDDPAAVYWATGALAGCAVNASLTNAKYSGEYAIQTEYTQTQLEAAIKAGKFIFHKVDEGVRVLADINTFISVSDVKGEDFSSNQTIRVLDQIGNDIALLFNTKYLGKAPNDAAGRISLWNDIVKHHKELLKIRAIENFAPEHVTVSKGEHKKAVVVEDYVSPVSAMAQLYMTVIVQ